MGPRDTTVGDAPERVGSGPGYNGNRQPRNALLGAGVSSAALDSGADFAGAQTERVVVYFYLTAAALATFSIHFGISSLAAAAATDMTFPANTLVPLVVSAKRPFFRAISTAGGELRWYTGA